VALLMVRVPEEVEAPCMVEATLRAEPAVAAEARR
jgi:hypothetical protein